MTPVPLQHLAVASLGLMITGLLGSVVVPASAQVGSRPIKVAAVDFIPAWGDRDGNIRRLVQALSGWLLKV
ncbi:hypothetical protein [Synechococcus sp. MW101C3]|uniref:hypothetical protein n=1 Tax=Synechococcus sp. MW101C3 TaxID=210768 RepID=UPI0018E9FE21|nr:hypothetical protein [Synechococcus sp. MW101C3]